MEDIDLLIIGSGPAGISTALHLLRCDPTWAERMLILEKEKHPRPKLCGGGVTRLGLQILTDLGLSLPLPIPQVLVKEVQLIFRECTIRLHGKPQFIVFHRPELDAYLSQYACQQGVQIRENEPAQELLSDQEGVTVITRRASYRAKAVVGADGSKGLTRQLLHQQKAPSRIARVLEVFTPLEGNGTRSPEPVARFDFSAVQAYLQGYVWQFPCQVKGLGYANHGIYDARIAWQRPRARLAHLLNMNFKEPVSSPPVAGHPIHWFSPFNSFSQSRLLLVGDAAGVDPLFGEGIAPALGYGQVASQTIQQAFANQDFSFRDYRFRLLRSYTGRYLLIRWIIAWWCYRLSHYDGFMRILWALGNLISKVIPEPAVLNLEQQIDKIT